MPLLRTLGRILTAPFRRGDAGLVLGSDPAPPVVRRPLAPAGSDPMQQARRAVEKVRTAVRTGRLQFLPFWDNLTEETPEIRQQYPGMLREPTLKAALCTKVLAVSSLDVQVHPADADDPRHRAAGDCFHHALHGIRGGRTGLAGPRKVAWNVLAPLLVNGWSFSETVWRDAPERSGQWSGKLLYQDFKSKDTRFLWPLVDQFKNVTGYRAGAYNAGHIFEGAELRDFVTAAHLSFHENPLGMSDFRAVWRAYTMKTLGMNIWGLHLDKWAKGPFLKGTYANPDRIATLEAALAEAQANTWITVPVGDLVEVMDLGMGDTAGYQAFVEHQDREMLIGTVGAYMQILEGQTPGGRGDTGIHKEISELFQWALAALLGDVVSQQMAPAWYEVNCAGVEPATVTWGSVSEAEMEARLRVDEGLQKLGMRLSQKEAYAFYGRQRPVDEADVLKPEQGGGGGEGGPGPGTPPGAGGPGGGNGTPPGPEEPPSPFDAAQETDARAYAEGFSGEKKDALGRRRCYEGGKPVPCAEDKPSESPGVGVAALHAGIDALPDAPKQFGPGWAAAPFPADTDPPRPSGDLLENKVSGRPEILIGRTRIPIPPALVSVDDLVATQVFVGRTNLLRMAEAKGPLPLPIVVRSGGKDYLFEGTHRATLAKLRGEKTLRVALWDDDAFREGREQPHLRGR